MPGPRIGSGAGTRIGSGAGTRITSGAGTRITSGAGLNPVENIWQFMRDNWLSNRIFTDQGDIVDHCCQAWNRLTDLPSRITSIGMRDWAHGL